MIKHFQSVDYNPETKEGNWNDYGSTNSEEFRQPGKRTINSTNPTDIAIIKNMDYDYKISDKIRLITSDRILISDLLAKGVNKENNGVNTSNITQWLASKGDLTSGDYVAFCLYAIDGGQVAGRGLFYSNSIRVKQGYYYVRPVVTLQPNVTLTNVDGVWQINQ